MTYYTASQVEADRRPVGIIETVKAFLSAWFEASAAYATYQALSNLSDAELAERGIHRQDIARTALDLPVARR